MLLLAAIHVCCYAQKNTDESGASVGFPRFDIKTNLLYDATGTVNLGAELSLSAKTSLDLSGNWNPWTWGENRKWKHILVQPEFRLWTKEALRGPFFGLHGHYAYYNVGNLPKPPFSQNMKDHRYEGWLAGAGLGSGYRWNFSHKFGLEAEIGVGYAYIDYDKFKCGACGEKLGNGAKHYLGPTKAAISLVYRFGGRKKAALLPLFAPSVVERQPEPEAAKVLPKYTVAYITPGAEELKLRSEENKAYLDFPVGQAAIVSSFGRNPEELQKIDDLIVRLKNDPDVTITGISITGYASPEGLWANNRTLSEKRASALMEHLRSVYGFPADLFSVEGGGEDWDMLDSLVAGSSLAGKREALEIIRSKAISDEKEKTLKAFAGGGLYAEIRANFFPQLRRSDCSLRYTITPFTVEKGRKVFETNPERLSLNELFLIANTYMPGSDAFNEVFVTAALLYPDNDDALVNSAASALERGDTELASHYLDRVGTRSAEYYNNRAIIHLLRGEYDQADDAFRKSSETTKQ